MLQVLFFTWYHSGFACWVLTFSTAISSRPVDFLVYQKHHEFIHGKFGTAECKPHGLHNTGKSFYNDTINEATQSEKRGTNRHENYPNSHNPLYQFSQHHLS